MELNTKDILSESLNWWNELTYREKCKYSEGYILPTNSAIDPVLFLDENIIVEIYTTNKIKD